MMAVKTIETGNTYKPGAALRRVPQQPHKPKRMANPNHIVRPLARARDIREKPQIDTYALMRA